MVEKYSPNNIEILNYARRIVGVSPIDEEDIEHTKFDDENENVKVLTRAVEEFLIEVLVLVFIPGKSS